MRSVSSALVTKLAADNVALIALWEVAATTPFYRAFWSADVTFNGTTYTADSGSFDVVGADLKLARPEYAVTFQNVASVADDTALPWSSYDLESLKGVEVKLRVVEESLLADTDAVILEQNWHISGTALDHEAVQFRLEAPYDALAIELPRLPLGAKTCWWRYKQGPCTSQSDEATCPKTVAGCKARFPAGAVLPFGPSYPFMGRSSRVAR